MTHKHNQSTPKVRLAFVRPQDSYTDHTAAQLEREADKVFFNPRTKDKDSFCTGSDAVHRMPRVSKIHMAGMPRVPYHRMMNAQCVDGELKPTGQLKTVWGDNKHGYVSKREHDKHTGPRWNPHVPVAQQARAAMMVRVVPSQARQVTSTTVVM